MWFRAGARMDRQLLPASDSLKLRQLADGQVVGVDIHDFGTTFKAYRREVIQNIPLYGEMHRSFQLWQAGMAHRSARFRSGILTARRAEPLRHRRTFRVFFDLLTSASCLST